MKQRLYIDTSVFGGYYDQEFAAHTMPLFDRINRGDFTVLLSAITQEELMAAPLKVRALSENLPEHQIEFIEVVGEAVDLAQAYINEKVVGATSFADCLHIALATINRADFLLSWNFKHIVNMQRISGYNAINIRQGYKPLEIRSPREFESYGETEENL